MTIESVHALFLDETGAVSLAQLTELSGLSEDELRDLVECGALAPFDAGAPSWTFGARCVVVARNAYRLREDFALDDAHSLAVLVRLFQRIESLEREIDTLRARR
ncbi:MAG: chaperone modulator CbpM [Burkholderiales bacterium]